MNVQKKGDTVEPHSDSQEFEVLEVKTQVQTLKADLDQLQGNKDDLHILQNFSMQREVNENVYGKKHQPQLQGQDNLNEQNSCRKDQSESASIVNLRKKLQQAVSEQKRFQKLYQQKSTEAKGLAQRLQEHRSLNQKLTDKTQQLESVINKNATEKQRIVDDKCSEVISFYEQKLQSSFKELQQYRSQAYEVMNFLKEKGFHVDRRTTLMDVVTQISLRIAQVDSDLNHKADQLYDIGGKDGIQLSITQTEKVNYISNYIDNLAKSNQSKNKQIALLTSQVSRVYK